MKIRVIIELEENDESFRVTSRPHESITAAFCEVGQVAEKQRKLIKEMNETYLYIL